MGRAPYNVLVLPYRRAQGVEYCVFERTDMRIWQFIAGGGEDGEMPIDAARREAMEEGGIPASLPYQRLTTLTYVPVNCFSRETRRGWGSDTLVIPVHCFAVEVPLDLEIALSPEHTQYRWANYDAAADLLRYDVDRTALWELKERLRLAADATCRGSLWAARDIYLG